MTEEGFNNMEFLLNQIFIELRKSNELKERELRQQLFFTELIEETLPIDDNKKRIIHQKTMRSYLDD